MKKASWYDPTPHDELVLSQEALHIAVAEAIDTAMANRGVNRSELARRCGITRSALSQRLSGRKSMTLATVAEMLHVLGAGLEVKLVEELSPELEADATVAIS